MSTTRRTFLAGSFALLATSLAVAAHQGRVYHIGVVHQGGSAAVAIDGVRDGLRELGLEEGKHFLFEVRDVKGDLTAVEVAARGLEGEQVDVIWALSTSTTLAVMRATKRVPIVFYAGSDPVALGLVDSVRRPGRRLTGIHGWTTDLTAKRLELLRDIVPGLRRVVTFYNPNNRSAQHAMTVARDAARQLKVELLERPVASIAELRAALRALRPGDADAHLHVSDAMMTSQADLIIQTAMTKRLPTMFQEKEAVDRGALASYGISYYAIGRHSAKYIQQVLLGTNPGGLPVEQLDRLHLVINLKTAKALGLTIPPSLLLRADQVIE